MSAALRSRLERLEVVVSPKKPDFFRSDYLKTLPADYVGERYVVIVKREPAGATGQNVMESAICTVSPTREPKPR